MYIIPYPRNIEKYFSFREREQKSQFSILNGRGLIFLTYTGNRYTLKTGEVFWVFLGWGKPEWISFFCKITPSSRYFIISAFFPIQLPSTHFSFSLLCSVFFFVCVCVCESHSAVKLGCKSLSAFQSNFPSPHSWAD